MKLSIVIPNFNGLDLLKKNLPSVIKHKNGAKVIIVDDASTDASVAWIQKTYPQIKVVVNQLNLGFADSVNRGFNTAKSDLVLLLNNDVSLQKDTISHLTGYFKNSQTFAVGCLEILPDGSKRGKSAGKFSRGLFVHCRAPSLKKGSTMWVFAASGLFNRRIWNRLGGLDPVFKPAYWEDIDICFRAWKSGFNCLFEPQAKVNHDSESTMNQVLGPKKQIYAFKNQLLFVWKNITSPMLLAQHLLWLPYHLIVTTIRSRGAFLIAFTYAIAQLSQVSKSRSKLRFNLSDHDIFSLFSATTS